MTLTPCFSFTLLHVGHGDTDAKASSRRGPMGALNGVFGARISAVRLRSSRRRKVAIVRAARAAAVPT